MSECSSECHQFDLEITETTQMMPTITGVGASAIAVADTPPFAIAASNHCANNR